MYNHFMYLLKKSNLYIFIFSKCFHCAINNYAWEILDFNVDKNYKMEIFILSYIHRTEMPDMIQNTASLPRHF